MRDVRWERMFPDELEAAFKACPVVYFSYDQVEHVWETVIRPELPNFRTLQTAWAAAAALPEDSVWYANWKIPDREF